VIHTIVTEQLPTSVLKQVKEALDSRNTENVWLTRGRLEDCLQGRDGEYAGANECELVLTPSGWDDFTGALAWHAAMTSHFMTWADFWVLVNNQTTHWHEFHTESDYKRFYGDEVAPCDEGLDGLVECALGARHGCDHTGKTKDGVTVTWSVRNVIVGEKPTN